jgi:aspartyl-tRNA(Asn)/glutamyl-tRNA(Gln) amidotransferase subunit C
MIQNTLFPGASMKITREEVEHVALLARLKVNEDEIQRFTGQLNRILEYVDQLGRLDTTRVAPTFHAVARANVFRADRVQPSMEPPESLRNAPEGDGTFFRVPKIIE